MVNEVKVSYSYPNWIKRKVISSRDTYDLLLPIWDNIDYYESAKLVILNRQNLILGVSNISQGSTGGTVVDPKIVFQIALKTNAAAIIVAHNHPSMSLSPSNQDKLLTEKLKNAGLFLDLPLLDHVILTSKSYFSFADEGLL